MSTLTIFYSKPENIDKLIPIVTGKSRISLRLIDWFVTNFAKAHGTMYAIDYVINGEQKQRQFMVHTNYKAQLKAFSKRLLDPFCRGPNIEFVYAENKSLMTTVGQLTFFRWCISSKILEYISEHFDEIEEDMTNATKDVLPGQRKQLSIAASRTITKHEVKMTVEFN